MKPNPWYLKHVHNHITQVVAAMVVRMPREQAITRS